MKLRTLSPVAFAGLALSLAAPSRAIGDLSGTYEGKLRCETTENGVVSRTKEDVTVLVAVIDDGPAVAVEIVTVQDKILGYLIDDAVKAESAVLQAMSCFYESLDQTGLVARLAARNKVPSQKASLKGTLLRSDIPAGKSATCTLDVKRVSVTPPEIALCVHSMPI
jgi:hypothetical protein